MAVNPALVQTYEGRLVPAPFANEVFVLTRPKVGFELDGVQTRNGKCVLDPATSSMQLAMCANVELMQLRWDLAGGHLQERCSYPMSGWCS